jgi:hypothetical protein
VGVAAAGARVRLRDDVLASAAGLAARGGLERLHRLLLEELHQAGQIDWERAAVDGSHVRAMKGR